MNHTARRREAAAVGLVLIATVAIVFLTRRPGHWWGDDWALYVRQAEAIFSGGVRDVVADNRFTVERSGLPEFSPPMYPWGFPLLLSPFVAVLGTDLDRLVVAQALFFCWFLVAWYRLARPRVGLGLAMSGLLVLALSPQYVGWAELVQSEISFMAVAVTALVVLDSRRVRSSLVTLGAPVWPLIVMGAVAAGAFLVRREGLAVIGAIGIAQVAAIARWSRERRLDGQPIDRDELRHLTAPVLGRLALPFAAAGGTIALSELLLPSTLVPSYTGNGLHNVVRFAPNHLGHVMESIGLQQIASGGPTVLGNAALGAIAVAMFLLLLVAGLGVALWRRPQLDLPIAACMIALLMIGGSFRAPGSRYVALVGPLALIFVLIALRELSRRLPRHRIGAAVALSLVALVVVGNAVKVADRAVSAREFARGGHVVWGPDSPESLEMFAAVSRHTGPDDVIGFFKARAMTQRTDRRAIQVDEFRPVDRAADVLTHIVLQNTPDDAVPVTIDPDRYTQLWSNDIFTLHTSTN